ncbi:MAG: hypothetical protein ACYCU0_09890 [Solirubrobacteraceae bacterium]
MTAYLRKVLGLNPQLDDEAPAESIHKGTFRQTLLAANAFLAEG